MENERTCIDCKIEAPETNTEYTLISTQAWRIIRRDLGDGTFAFEWRCPSCWKKYKLRTGATSGPIQRPALPSKDPAPSSTSGGAGTPPAGSKRGSKPPKSSR